MDEVNVSVYLDDDEALALAQLVKRLGWNEMRQNAVSEDETYLMRSALAKLMTGLYEAGYSPR